MARLTFCVPSYVKVTNPQLVGVYWFFTCCMGIALAVRFYWFEFYLGALFLDDLEIHVNLWTVLPHQRRSWDDIVQSPLCASPASFHYVWDDNFVYDPSGCSRICNNASDVDCVAEGMATRRTLGGRSEVFIATLTQVTTRDSTGAVSRHSTFLPEAEQISIGASIACAGEIRRKGVSDDVFELCDWGSAKLNTLVVLLNSRTVGGDLNQIRQVNKTFPIGESMTFGVEDILWLAGIEGGLTHPTVEKVSRPATLGDTGARPPALAVAGMILQFVVHCHNFFPADVREQLPEFKGVYEKVCTVAFVPLRSRWGELQTFDGTGEDGAYVDSYSTGLHIVGMPGGTFTFLDTVGILDYLISSAILMKIPRILLLFFCTAFMGHISHIYSRAIFRHFDIEKEVAGMATRLMATTITFRELQRIGDKDLQTRQNSLGHAVEGHGDTKRIALATVEHQLKQALQERETELEAREVNAFIKFVYHGITAAPKKGRPSSLVGRLSHGVRLARTAWNLRRMSSIANLQDDLGVDQFNIAHASNETIDFDSVCRLFDTDRRVGCVERLFTPAALRHAIFNATLPGPEAPPQADEMSICTSQSEAPASCIGRPSAGAASDAEQMRPRTDVDAGEFGSFRAVQHAEIEARLELFRQEVNSRLGMMSQLIDKIAVASEQAEMTTSKWLSERLTVLETHILRSASEGSSKSMASAESTAVHQGSKAPLAAEEGADANGLSLQALAKVVENLQLEVLKLKMEVGTVVKEQILRIRRHVTAHLPPPPVGAAGMAAQPRAPQAWVTPSLLYTPLETSPERESGRGPSHAQQEPAPAPPRQHTDVVIGAAAAEVARGAQQSRVSLALPHCGYTDGSENSSAANLLAEIAGRQQVYAIVV